MNAVPEQRHHIPGLDGLRAVAVIAVVAYHLKFGWASGGFLGVDLFFVLSGFLITSLLLDERVRDGRVRLGAFWLRRARRLLPALYVMIAVVVSFPLVVSLLGHPGLAGGVDIGELRGFALSSVFYVANWFAIISSHSYFAQYAAPSPLAHTWSLAIEEQFYLAWPFVILLLAKGRPDSLRRRGVLACGVLAVASSTSMALIYASNAGGATNYVYNATFTRLFDLAIGAALAFFVLHRDIAARWQKWASAIGSAALLALLAAMAWAGLATGVPRASMFYGGFLVCSLLAAIVIASVRVEGSVTSRVLSLAPLRLIGRVSYGVYLWHYPVIVFVTPRQVPGGSVALLAVRLVLIALLTTVSYVVIEQPIRQQRWPLALRRVVFPTAALGTVVVVILATTASLFPVTNWKPALAQYAPTSPAVGSGDVQGVVTPASLNTAQLSPTHRLRVLILGDSVAYYSSFGLDAMMNAMPDVAGQVAARVGWGLARRSHWSFYAQSVAAYRPQVVVPTSMYDRSIVQDHTAEYEKEFTRFLHVLRGEGVAYLVFASLPVQGIGDNQELSPQQSLQVLQNYARWAATWDQAARDVQRANPDHVLFMPVGNSVLLLGHFAFWIPPSRAPHTPQWAWQRVRMIDGTHLCPVGTEMWAAALGDDLGSSFHVSAPKGPWWMGSWSSDAWHNIFAPSPNWCPMDHPSA